ncbi:hypothetical protein T265_08696 [Opisthorchis viverrini]|uniref:Uncharacterized protein n=1 Tax=Opisthorchis viverrini TaxID=6198 RepID=A0A074Z8G8_OPIVI|nr:hypothetical protein T265_08696 [Opisthorchis viverrini]KER23423.1 hypothetical protein T265_08696 [Opisthorchis viverrini]
MLRIFSGVCPFLLCSWNCNLKAADPYVIRLGTCGDEVFGMPAVLSFWRIVRANSSSSFVRDLNGWEGGWLSPAESHTGTALPFIDGRCYGREAYPAQDWPKVQDACQNGIKSSSDWSKV